MDAAPANPNLVRQATPEPVRRRSARRRRAVALIVSSFLAATSAPLEPAAMPATPMPAVQEEAPEPAAADDEAPQEPKGEDEEEPQPEVSWLDWIERGMQRTVSDAARWFDGFFGSARYDQETDRTSGRLAIDVLREGDESPDVDVDFHARVALPNLDRRVDALFGRESEDGLLSEPGAFEPPAAFRDPAEDRDWLLGLGYRPVSSSRRRLGFQAGVNLRFPLEPFVQGRYRRHFPLGDVALVRLRETLFWRGEDGFGSTSALDLERVLGQRFLIRWGNSVTVHQKTDGAAWRSGVTLFQNLGHGRAMAYRAELQGETDAEVPLARSGLRLTYRQSLLREWLFGEVVTGLTWPRRELAEDREAEWVLGFGLELQFGETP